MRKLLILALLPLAACGKQPVIVEVPTPPADKLVCQEEPGRPIGKGDAYTDSRGIQRRAVTDEEAARYMMSLRSSGQSCRDDVQWMRDWFKALAR